MDEMQDMPISPELPSILPTVAEINRLPPEMLAGIFVYLSRQEPDSAGRKASHSVQDLISVTHVCTLWRRAAITAPGLWTEITMMNLEMTKAFLERSRAVPLNVDLRPSSGTELNTVRLDMVIPHIHRLRQLSVHTLTRRDYLTRALTSFTEPVPLLERLVIRHPLGGRSLLLFGDQAPRLRELVIVSDGLRLQNRLGSLTSLHVTLPWMGSDFLPFFDMLRRCPVLEEMFVSWSGRDPPPPPPQLPTVPLRHLRKLFLHLCTVGNIRYLLHSFDLRANGIAIHLSSVHPQGNYSISDIQTIFPNDNSSRPSLTSSTKLELIFHTQPQTFIMHAVGPGFSTRIDLGLRDFGSHDVNYTFHDIFPLVKELWVRGLSRMGAKLHGIEHFTALEKLVLIGKGPKVARIFRQALSPDPSGALPCPLLSTIDCHGNASEMREIFLLLRKRFTAGRRFEKVRVPSSFIPLPADTASCVREVESLDIPSRVLHMYAMELPEFCFAEKGHEWWEPWRSKLG